MNGLESKISARSEDVIWFDSTSSYAPENFSLNRTGTARPGFPHSLRPSHITPHALVFPFPLQNHGISKLQGHLRVAIY